MESHKLKRFKLGIHPHYAATIEVMLALVVCMVMSTVPVSAVVRFQARSLMVSTSAPGATADYTISMEYATQTNIGSLDLLFCIDPIPYEPCVTPTGLDVSHATLSSQTGETGYSITTHTANHLVLSRTPAMVQSGVQSTYVLSGIVNPTYETHSFSIRMSNYASQDATGPVVDLGSVITQINDSIVLQAQVPPMLIFCLAKQVSQDCTSTDGGNYEDLGTLSPKQTLTDQSQMAVGTNASGGFAITVNGLTLSSGLHTIDAPTTPSPSILGTNQFGINLVANNSPSVGSNPDGDSTNAIAAANYSQPNRYMYKDGDVIASSPNVSLIRRFTVSYIINANQNLRAGVYTTTLTYICSGRF